jgi:glucan phosphoethanolaminetransferase (alkaline phosphatase superfamily)
MRDNVFHTVMGAIEVHNQTYRAQLDILAPCEI